MWSWELHRIVGGVFHHMKYCGQLFNIRVCVRIKPRPFMFDKQELNIINESIHDFDISERNIVNGQIIIESGDVGLNEDGQPEFCEHPKTHLQRAMDLSKEAEDKYFGFWSLIAEQIILSKAGNEFHIQLRGCCSNDLPVVNSNQRFNESDIKIINDFCSKARIPLGRVIGGELRHSYSTKFPEWEYDACCHCKLARLH